MPPFPRARVSLFWVPGVGVVECGWALRQFMLTDWRPTTITGMTVFVLLGLGGCRVSSILGMEPDDGIDDDGVSKPASGAGVGGEEVESKIEDGSRLVSLEEPG